MVVAIDLPIKARESSRSTAAQHTMVAFTSAIRPSLILTIPSWEH
jgi:hypothetical protein